jgi:hypothetical protein
VVVRTLCCVHARANNRSGELVLAPNQFFPVPRRVFLVNPPCLTCRDSAKLAR